MANVFTADKFTSTSKQIEYYSDFSIDLDIHPGKKDIVRKTNEEAIKRSIKNLILTNSDERFFQPGIATNLNRILFELADNDALDLAQEQVTAVLNLYEKRIRIIEVIANAEPDMNSISLTLTFSVLNTGKIVDLVVILDRVR